MKKKIIVTVFLVGFALSMGLNLWSFGWKALKAHDRKIYSRAVADVNAPGVYSRGVNDAVMQVIAQARQGKVIINTNNGPLVLIPVDPNSGGT